MIALSDAWRIFLLIIQPIMRESLFPVAEPDAAIPVNVAFTQVLPQTVQVYLIACRLAVIFPILKALLHGLFLANGIPCVTILVALILLSYARSFILLPHTDQLLVSARLPTLF